jgi:hypothetical protein
MGAHNDAACCSNTPACNAAAVRGRAAAAGVDEQEEAYAFGFRAAWEGSMKTKSLMFAPIVCLAAFLCAGTATAATILGQLFNWTGALDRLSRALFFPPSSYPAAKLRSDAFALLSALTFKAEKQILGLGPRRQNEAPDIRRLSSSRPPCE